jgi:hypothetical protein
MPFASAMISAGSGTKECSTISAIEPSQVQGAQLRTIASTSAVLMALTSMPRARSQTQPPMAAAIRRRARIAAAMAAVRPSTRRSRAGSG